MSAHKSIDKICVIITVITLLISVIFCNGQALGIEKTAHATGYENRLFDNSKVHTFDIVINDWDGFIENCESEEYSPCNIVIDGEAVKNVGIRAKGNTSLSSVRNMNSSRYSFKIEFDQYENGKTYHGLDKLCLNNIIQDNTYMKDYLAYTLMNDFGVDSPLCSYVYITVNGEDWGLYLAVEAIEHSFLERNYGSGYGELYKPDSMSFGGGGPGNGKDFSMSDFMNKNSEDSESSGDENSFSPGGFGGGMPDFGGGDFDPSQFFGGDGEMPDFGSFDPSQFGDGEMPDFGDFDPSEIFGGGDGEGKGGFGGFGMGSDDVKLKYSDDDIDSYSNIFNNAKTLVDYADKKRLIRSLKALLEQSDLENTVDVDEVIRYFVVHNFLVNGDSYTGQMIHNYYLYEEDGQLSMIPWDYNLAYGSFMGGKASSSVNSPIDTPVSNGMSDRPMVSWIFDNEEYTELYHQLFSEFLDSVDFEELISETAALIDKYVEKDPTKFCTYEDFKTGVEAITKFCTLREESVSGQLEGTIPSTTEGQKADSSALIDCGDLNTSDMGSMNNGGGGFGGFGGRNGKDAESSATISTDKSGKSGSSSDKPRSSSGRTKSSTSSGSSNTGSGAKATNMSSLSGTSGIKVTTLSERSGRGPSGGQPPEGFDPGNIPDFGGEMPGGFGSGSRPGGSDEDAQAETKPENNDIPGDDAAVTEDGTSADSSAPAEIGQQGGNPGRPGGSGDGSRPSMGDFPGMGGAAQNNTAAYILLGASALVLLAGLGFAAKFRR